MTTTGIRRIDGSDLISRQGFAAVHLGHVEVEQCQPGLVDHRRSEGPLGVKVVGATRPRTATNRDGCSG